MLIPAPVRHTILLDTRMEDTMARRCLLCVLDELDELLDGSMIVTRMGDILRQRACEQLRSKWMQQDAMLCSSMAV